MNLDDVVRAADLDDRTERSMLADALEEAGRGGEAALLREPGTVAVMDTLPGKLFVAPWHRRAEAGTLARCTLAEWLEYGPDVIQCNRFLCGVEITDKRPQVGVYGLGVEFYNLPDKLSPSVTLTAVVPTAAVIDIVLAPGECLPSVHSFVDEGDAMLTLSARCLEWARRRASEQATAETFDGIPF